MRFGLVLLLASLILVLAAPAVAPAGEVAGAGISKAKKHKAKKCKKTQVRLTIGKRSRCVPLKAALPKPKAVDQRLAVVREGLTPPLGTTPDPKDKLPPSMEKVYRQFGPKALTAMEKAVGTAIPKLDRLASVRARPLGGLGASASEAGNTFSQTVGGVKIDARLSIAIEATGQFVGRAELSTTTDQGSGKTLKVTTEVPIRLERFGFESDVCPGADGKLDAKDGIGITVRSELRSNGGKSLDEYYIYEVADDTEMQGVVGDDAKLDTLEIRSIEDITEKAWQPILGGLIAHGTVVRNTVVDMRTGDYKPSVTVINVGVVLSGLRSFFPGAAREGVAERLKQAADKGFAATVDFEMKKYRELESAWMKPNTCAKLKFNRANRSLTPHRGDKGDESVQVDAIRGGSPAKAKWTLVSGANGIYRLGSDATNPTSFSYEVGHAGPDVEVKATFKAVSKAGVAEDSWIQKTEQKSIEHIGGTFSERTSFAGSVLEWSGSVTFDRFTPPVLGGPNGSFKLSSGLYTVTASGNGAFLGGPTCSMHGSSQFALAPSGEIFVFGTPPDLVAPYEYSFGVSSNGVPMMDITLSACPPKASELEKTYSWPVAFNLTGLGVSGDGIGYAGSQSEGGGSLTTERAWSFQGTE